MIMSSAIDSSIADDRCKTSGALSMITSSAVDLLVAVDSCTTSGVPPQWLLPSIMSSDFDLLCR